MKKRIGAIVFVICVFLYITVCKSPTSPEVPEPMIKILATLFAKYVFSGTDATGTVNYKSTDGTVDKTVNIGEQAELGEEEAGKSKEFTITVEGAGALKRIYKMINLSGTTTIDNINLLELDGFGIDDFVNHFIDQCDNQNRIWQPSTLTCYIDPSLPQDYITETENAIKEVVGYSKGVIAAPIFVYEAKPADVMPGPPDGEIWVNSWTELKGVTNKQYPVNGDVVTASKMWVNLNSVGLPQIRDEVFDLFIQENQNIFINQYIAKHFEFALKHRPKGNQNSYRIYTDREEQQGFDSSESIQVWKPFKVGVQYEEDSVLINVIRNVPKRYYEEKEDTLIKEKRNKK